MLRFDNYGSITVHASGTTPAAGGTFSTTPVDFSTCDGNLLVSLSVNSAGTGTLAIVAEMGTASASTWTTIGTWGMFTNDNSATGTAFAAIVSGTNAQQTRVIALNKVQPFVRFTTTGTGSNYSISIVTIAPQKYANFGV